MATTVTQTVRIRRINGTSFFVIACVYGYQPHVGASATPFSPSHKRRKSQCIPYANYRESGNATPAQVSALLAENIVFKSPILVRPIEGREVIAAIFAQSSSTRGSGAYTAEFKLDRRTTFLRWEGTMDGHKIESLEVIVDNEQGLIEERTIALRPYPAVKLFRDAMYASLKDKLPPDVWDYATP